MVKRLMAKHQIDAGIGHIERRDIATTKFYRKVFFRRLHPGALQTFLFSIDSDQTLRRKMLNQRPERFTLPTAGVEHDWVGCFAFRNQPFQIVESDAYDVLVPRFRAEKLKANTRFADEFYIATRLSCHLATLLKKAPKPSGRSTLAAAL